MEKESTNGHEFLVDKVPKFVFLFIVKETFITRSSFNWYFYCYKPVFGEHL